MGVIAKAVKTVHAEALARSLLSREMLYWAMSWVSRGLFRAVCSILSLTCISLGVHDLPHLMHHGCATLTYVWQRGGDGESVRPLV